ncbi:MAG: FG-GAP-like repeat-containing protein [Saprospiraceae bacterium]
MLSKLLIFACLVLLFYTSVHAQSGPISLPAEICDNGVDDDGDSLVDCYDPDCHCFSGADCSVTELPSDFRVRLAWEAAQNGPSITATPVTANMNPMTDDMPEIIVGAAANTTAATPNRILFFRGDGSNAANPFVLTVPGGFNPYPVPGPVLGDIDNDGTPELIMSCNDRYIRVFRNYTENLTTPMTLWVTSTDQIDLPDQRPYLADFDGDGISEIYTGNDVFRFNLSNPASPTLFRALAGPVAAMGRAHYSNYSEGSCNPTAVDILSLADCNGDPDCAGLEIAAGSIIYSIDLTTADGDGMQIKIQRNLNTIVPNSAYGDGYTAVADVDLDGILDVIVSGRRGIAPLPVDYGVYVWNKNGLIRFLPYPSGNQRSGSLACVANIFDDRTAGFAQDFPEIVVCNAYNLNCFNLQAATLTPAAPYWWTLPTTDYSGFTGSTVYDFNGDGVFELVYRDENHLRILYGGAAPFPPGVDTERNWYRLPCGSITSDEYAIVADVDNDGETEIAVTGYTFSGYNNPSSDYRGRLRVFESDADPWMPCRNVWNQYNYFVVNVNDDLSIPAEQQLHHLELPGPGSGNRLLNRYLSQRPQVNEDFLPFLPVADAAADSTWTTCANDSIVVHLRLCNLGSDTLPAGTPVAFYDADPTATNASLIGTAQPIPAALAPDSCAVFLFKIPRIAGKPLFGVANDNGSRPRPYDLATEFPVTNLPECEWLNNLFQFDPALPLVQLDTVNGDCLGSPGRVAASGISDFFPLNYIWSNADTMATLHDPPDGTFTVTVTDTRGCTVSAATPVVAGAWLDAAVATLDVLCHGGQNGGAGVTVLGGTPGFSYAWSTSDTTETVLGLAAGVYTVTITFGNGKCSQIFEREVTQPQPLLSYGVTASAACPGLGNGSLAFLGAAQGTPPYDLKWSNGSADSQQTGLYPNTYTLTLTDANNCTLTEVVEVGLFAEPDLGTTLSHISCFGTADGSIVVGLFGGTPGFGFQWSSGDSTATVQNLAPGQYTVTVSFADGKCSLARDFEITQPQPLLSNGTAVIPACPDVPNGSAAFLGAAQGTPPYSIFWSTGNAEPAQSNLLSGNYALTLTDAHGCKVVETVFVPEYQAPAITAASTDVSCFEANNGSLNVTLTGGTPDFGFLWENNTTNPNRDNLGPGLYALTVTYAGGKCSMQRFYELAQPTALIANGISTTAACPGVANGSATFLGAAHGTPPYTLLWSTGSAAPDQPGLVAGPYSITVTDANGCSLTQTAQVPEHIAPTMSATTTDVACFGAANGSIAVTLSGGTPGFAFLWENNATTPVRANLGPGQYTLTVSFASGKCSISRDFKLIEPSALLSNGTTTTPACPGKANGSAVFLGAAQGTPPYTLMWSTGSAAPDQQNLSAGTYALTVTDANGCTRTDSATVPEHPGTHLSTAPKPPLCAGGTDGSIDLTVAGGTAPFIFSWSNGQTAEDPTGLSAGQYALTSTDAVGCTAVISVELSQPSALSVQVVVAADTCELSTGSLSTTTTGGTAPYTFFWKNGQTQPALTALTEGAYPLTVTDGNGCTKTLALEVPAHGKTPILSPFSGTITCAQPTTSIGVTHNQNQLTFAWAGPQGALPNQPVHTVSVPGTYAVTATNSFGCKTDVNVTVYEDREIPVADAGAASITVPCGAVSTLLNGSGSTSGPDFENRWRGTAGSTVLLDTLALVISAYQPGLYVHSVLNTANGCSDTDSVWVAWEAQVVAAVAVDSISCFGENDGRIVLQGVSGGSPPYRYSVDGSTFSANNVFPALPPGTYPLRVRDASGCQWQGVVTLTEPPQLLVRLFASDTVIQLGRPLDLVAVPDPPGVVLGGVVWLPPGHDYVPMALKQQVRPEESTEFSVQIFDLRGCPATDRVYVRVDNFNIYVPNVIYPGRPGNDAFTIFAGDGLRNIRLMRIYDRWGSHVFEKHNFQPNDLTVGWDGTDRGQPVNPGVFAWYAEVEFRDGQVRLLKGDVTVVR